MVLIVSSALDTFLLILFSFGSLWSRKGSLILRHPFVHQALKRNMQWVVSNHIDEGISLSRAQVLRRSHTHEFLEHRDFVIALDEAMKTFDKINESKT
jgi:hypothetical protein